MSITPQSSPLKKQLSVAAIIVKRPPERASYVVCTADGIRFVDDRR